MVRCFGRMYVPFHHGPHNFPCSLYLPYAWYDDVFEIPTKNVLAYHMRWWQSLGSYFFFSACLALGLKLGIQICYNPNRTKNIYVKASEDDEADSLFSDSVLLFGSTFIIFLNSMSFGWLWVVTSMPEILRGDLRSRKGFRNVSHDSSSAWRKLKKS